MALPLTGATLTSKEKLDIARQLSKLGVDIIEAGFPVASPDDFEAVRSIALDVGNVVDKDGYVPVICGLSRCCLAHPNSASADFAKLRFLCRQVHKSVLYGACLLSSMLCLSCANQCANQCCMVLA